MRFGCNRVGSRQPFGVACKQLRVVMHHRGAGTGRADNRVRAALFENFDEALCYRSRFVEVACIESRLRAARLSLVELDLTTHAPQHLDATHADAGPQLIDETSYKKRNLHTENI